MMPLFMVVALMNPLFNHYGVTVLFYLYNGTPVTLESVVYGLAMAVMLCEVIIWFQCYNKIMTSDKFIYLFGRVIPGFSLILSMCLRFVPRFKNRMKVYRRRITKYYWFHDQRAWLPPSVYKLPHQQQCSWMRHLSPCHRQPKAFAKPFRHG